MVPLQANNHREKGWQWLPDPPLLYLDEEKKERDRDRRGQTRTLIALHTFKLEGQQGWGRKSWLFSLRGCSRKCFKEGKKRQKLFHASGECGPRERQQAHWQWVQGGALSELPPESQWQFLGRNTPMNDWTSGCLGISFTWNPERRENNNRSQWTGAQPRTCGQCPVSLWKSTQEGGVDARHIRAFLI